MSKRKAPPEFDEEKFKDWGYRFEFRDRSRSARKPFQVEDFREKRAKKPRQPKVEKPEPPPKPRPPPPAKKKVVIRSPSPSDDEVFHEIIPESTIAEEAPIVEPQIIDGSICINLPIARTKTYRSSGTKKRKTMTVESIWQRVLNEILQDALDMPRMVLPEIPTYISCDLRYYNIDEITLKFGFFDVLVIDPPWKATNTSGYLSNQEIMDIALERLSCKGFCFLWVTQETMNIGYECLNKWGYECIDHLTWVRIKDQGKRVMIDEGKFLYHSTEICLVGHKSPPHLILEYRSKISNDLIISNIRKDFQKPDELYTIIDLLMPGSKKVEVFANNHNLRNGWLSLGNTVGSVYTEWAKPIICTKCSRVIANGETRYKHKMNPSTNLCTLCTDFSKMQDFYSFKVNNQDEIIHQYCRCDGCGMDPIWGIRFVCNVCDKVELCEKCFDKYKCPNHEFAAHTQIATTKALFSHVDKRCLNCFQQPILGPMFTCMDCKAFAICQNCFFETDPMKFDGLYGHSIKHHIEVQTVPKQIHKYCTCNSCGVTPIVGRKFRCEQCFNFDICERCFISKESRELEAHSTHKKSHTFAQDYY